MKTRQKISIRSKKKNSEPGTKAGVLRRWQRLLKNDHFDDRVTALCKEYDLTEYLPVEKLGQGTFTGGGPVAMQAFRKVTLSNGQDKDEGIRPSGEDFGSRLSKAVVALRQEFNLSPDFDALLRYYILWGESPKNPDAGPQVEVTLDQYDTPHVKIEITP